MKILLVSTNFFPELTGTGKYAGEMVDWLVERGDEVRIICAPPYYPEWRIRQGYSIWKYKKEISGNRIIFRCPLWIPKKTSGLKRLIHLFSFALSSLPVMLMQVSWRADIVICIQPPILNSFSALIVSKLSKSKSILHIQDFEIDAALELGIIKALWLKKFIDRTQLFLMQKFDIVASISIAMLAKVDQKGISKEKQVLFPNWVKTNAIFPTNKPSIYRTELDINSNVIVVLYSGNMGEKQGLETVIQAAHNMQSQQDIRFVMCGTGVVVEKIKLLAAGIKNIIWLDLQPDERLNELLNLADIHLLPQKAKVADFVMPSKLTGILSSGRPVIAMAAQETEIAKAVRNCGLIIDPENEGALVQAINRLAYDPKLRQTLGDNARLYALKNLEYNTVMQKFYSDISRLIV